MEFDEVVRRRRSVRDFSNKPVSFKMVVEAIDAAIQGPFAGNNNQLRFLIIEDQEMIKEITKISEQVWIEKAQTIVLVCSDETNLENIYGERGRVYSRQQAGAAIQTFLLKLADLNIGACWVGSYSDEALKQKLKIPGHIQIEAIIPIGYGQGKISGKKPEKRSLESSMFWEVWGQPRRPTMFEERREDYRPGTGGRVG